MSQSLVEGMADELSVQVGKGEDGSIGLLICSFLEPLRE